MRRNKFKKIMTVLMAAATVATMGFSAVACNRNNGDNGDGHDHNWKQNWGTTQHWEYCEDCDEETEKEDHTDVSPKDDKCDVCGATMPSESATGVYEITLNANGGTLGSVTKVNTANGKLASLPAAPTAPANKKFKGWYSAATGGTAVTTDTVFTGNDTIYAQWEDNGSATPTGVFTITLDANGGTLGSVKSVTTSGGKLANLPVAPTAPANKQFAGWYDAATGGNRISTDTVFDGNKTIYAHWDNAQVTEGANEYTVYLYAPNVQSGQVVSVSVWSPTDNPDGLGGAFSNNSIMSAVPDKAGWYSFTFKTDKDIKGGANFNLYVDDEQVATGYTDDKDWVYFVTGKDNIKWGSMAEAEAEYNPSGETKTFELYVHVNTNKLTSGVQEGINAYRVYAHGTSTLFGGDFLNSQLLVDDDDPNDDWYKVSIEVPKTLTGGEYSLIVHNKWKSAPDATLDSGEQYDACSFSIDDNGKYIGKYINIKGDSKAEVEAAEAEYEKNQSNTVKVKLHVQVNTSELTGSAYAVYTYYNGSPLGFGGWPGKVLEAETGHNGWYLAEVDLATVDLGKELSVIINNNNNGGQYDSASITFIADDPETADVNEAVYEIWITSGNVASSTAPQGY